MDAWWEVLAQEMARTGAYDLSRLIPEALSRAVEEERAVLWGLDRPVSRIVGYAASIPTQEPRWSEVAQVYLSPELRCNGRSSNRNLDDLLDAILGRVPRQNNIFCISRSAGIARRLRERGFVQVRHGVLDHPIRWARQLGIVCRLPKSVHYPEDLPTGEKERNLLVRIVA